jgi:hypothetical protein
MLQTAVRNAGGGNKPKPIDPKTTDYDIIFVGKLKASWVGEISTHFSNIRLKENLLLLILYRWHQLHCSGQVCAAERVGEAPLAQDVRGVSPQQVRPPPAVLPRLPLALGWPEADVGLH